MVDSPKVFIIILNWNGLKDTLECLDSVYKLDYRNFEVIVVDNASSESPAKAISGGYPRTILIENSENTGYTGGNNVAMRYAMAHNADYMWLLNNDAVVEADTLSKIVESAESSDHIGLVSPTVYYYDDPGKWQFAGSYMDWETFSLVGPDLAAEEVGKEFQCGDNICLWGTALLIKRSMVEKAGYLKEEYFAYWEDTEYSLRGMAHGFQNRLCASAKIFHKAPLDRVSKGEHFYYFMQRNRMLMLNEYTRSFRRRLSLKIRLLAELSYDIGQCGSRNKKPCFDGAWHGLNSISGPRRDDEKMPVLYQICLSLLSKCYPLFLSDLVTFHFKDAYGKIVKRSSHV